MKKHLNWLFGVYSILVMLPYFVPALNVIEPRILGIPFTVMYLWVLVGLCCALLWYLSRNVWDGYDGSDGSEGGEE